MGEYFTADNINWLLLKTRCKMLPLSFSMFGIHVSITHISAFVNYGITRQADLLINQWHLETMLVMVLMISKKPS